MNLKKILIITISLIGSIYSEVGAQAPSDTQSVTTTINQLSNQKERSPKLSSDLAASFLSELSRIFLNAPRLFLIELYKWKHGLEDVSPKIRARYYYFRTP